MKSLLEYLKISNIKRNKEWVDLGLPSGTLWATCNVGATKPHEYGLYLLWSDAKNKVGKYMPTKEQVQELTKYTKYKWTVVEGIGGGLFTGKNGNSIFLPAAGYYDNYNPSVRLAINSAFYWSFDEDCCLSFTNDTHAPHEVIHTMISQLPIRLVKNK